MKNRKRDLSVLIEKMVREMMIFILLKDLNYPVVKKSKGISLNKKEKFL